MADTPLRACLDRSTTRALGVWAVLVAVVFIDVLPLAAHRAFMAENTDLAGQFIHWLGFGFEEMKQGNLPLWNPHVFSGTPFLSNFQSALLYPPNLIFFVFPLKLAINLSIVAHLLLRGAGMILWARSLGVSAAGGLIAALVTTLGGAHFLHVYAGHLSLVWAVAWSPLILISVGRLVTRDRWRWALVGTALVALQVLAGHPQTVYYTALVAVAWLGLHLISASPRLIPAVAFAGLYAGGAAMSAIQLLPGIEVTAHSVRSGGITLEHASAFSLPPENLLTLVAPMFFGNGGSTEYWGRGYLWEGSLFTGAAALILAVIGATRGGGRSLRLCVVLMAVALMVVALGAHTPIFELLFNVLPGFDKFRGTCKLTVYATMFLALLAGLGFDGLVKDRRSISIWLHVLTGVAAGVLLAGAVAVWVSADHVDGWWVTAMRGIRDASNAASHVYLDTARYDVGSFVTGAGRLAMWSLLVAGVVAAATGALLWAGRSSARAPYMLAGLVALEVVIFARSFRATFDPTDLYPEEIVAFLDQTPGDYRVYQPANPNTAMTLGAFDIWGYDPVRLKRYATFMSWTQGKDDASEPSNNPMFERSHRLWRMLRCRYALGLDLTGTDLNVMELTPTLPRLLLVQNYGTAKTTRALFNALGRDDFDPAHSVVLESEPQFAPPPTSGLSKPPRPNEASDLNPAGSAWIVDEDSDELIIRADLKQPAILLITDVYAQGWHALPIPEQPHTPYRVMPANHILRAVPLAPGKHHFRLVYQPAGFIVGRWITEVSVSVYLALWAWRLIRARRHRAMVDSR